MAIDTLLEKFDIYYDLAGSKLGFMLAKGRNGAKLWRRDDERGLPESFAPGDISYANLSPDIQKVISHRYFHAGLGALEYEVEDDELYQILRYLRSQNIDTRCKGKAYPGPKIVSLPTISRTAATWVSPVSHKDPDADWSDEEEAYDGVTGTAADVTLGIDTWGKFLELYVPSISCSKIRFWYATQGTGTIDVDVYYDGAWNHLTATTETEGEYVEKPLGATYTVTAARVRLKASAAGAATLNEFGFYAEDTATGVPVCFAVFNDKKYFAKGNTLLKLNAAFDGYDVVASFMTAITHIAAYPDYLYIAVGGANKYWYMDTTTPPVFVESGLLAGETADRFCKVGADIWQLVLPNKMRKSSDPTDAGSWGVELLCGEAAYNVNDMWEHDGKLYCMKEDGPYYESGAVFYPAFPELASIAHSESGENSTVFRDGLYFRMGNQQEWEIKGGVLTEVTPEIFAPGISQYADPCVARAHDESWLYSIIKRGATDLAILAGRWEYIAGRSRWVWHEIRSIDLTDVATAFVCSVEDRPYLYLGSTLATENVYKVYLPITNDATADVGATGYRFHKEAAGVTLGSLYTPRYMTLLFAINKRWLEEYLRSENLSGTNYINVQYSTDDGGSFDLLKKFITSPEQTEAFTNIEATMMNLQFDFVSDSETVPPVLKYHNLKALTMMPSVTRFYHTIKCADGLRLKKNHVASPNYTSAIIRTFLDTIRDEVCTLGDRFGNEFTVKVRVLQELEVFDEDRKQPELQYSLEAVKL